ncbi:unnamed protein product [Diplocarpon coronariae]|uniref:Plasmid pRiA4b Orf3-like domain-containing protein n=1 Tax=Diplocarpon coronariae TaxID=2795749 RepID=A0A218Z014_9HELO|nr:hypothetical protein JHW43_004092 [Diplocarpon mali]OWP00635.1 hypothetical protein B2J93_5411 [Marssonina coronariae]
MDLSSIEDIGFNQTPARDSATAKLFSVLDATEENGQTLSYNYDFGDGWKHIVIVSGRTTSSSHFVCLEGEGHACAEDVSGHSGWIKMLKAYDAVKPTSSQENPIDWSKNYASNKDPKELSGERKWMWDKESINTILSELKTSVSAIRKPRSHKYSILLTSLDKMSFFDDMYSDSLAKLRSKARVVEVTHIASAM